MFRVLFSPEIATTAAEKIKIISRRGKQRVICVVQENGVMQKLGRLEAAKTTVFMLMLLLLPPKTNQWLK